MRTVKIGLIAALALGVLAFTGNVSAQDAKEKKGRNMPSVQERLDRMSTELNLTDAQKPKVKAVLEDQNKKMQELRGDSVTPEQRREKFQAMREEMNTKMKEILTPEQYTKYESMREQMRQKGGKGKNGEKKKSE